MANYKFEPYGFSESDSKNFPCYVCHHHGHASMHASTASKDSTLKIINMYEKLGLYAFLNTSDEAKGKELIITACKDHIPNLVKLDKDHRFYSRISPKSIVDSLK